jgi:taurine dioxygenase
MAYKHIEVRPISGALGAELHGIDLSQPVAPPALKEIKDAFLKYCVIFFRDQRLGPGELVEFAKSFGPIYIDHVLKGLPAQPEILEVLTRPEDEHVFAEGWHADVTSHERPVLGSILYALEVPPYGGDTLFSNQYLAYEALSPTMQKMLGQLRALHSNEIVYGAKQEDFDIKGDQIAVDMNAARNVKSVHPVVRTHPETKRKSLFVNDHYTTRFEGMSAEESRPILNYLWSHAIRPEFTCRFRWEVGSIAFWDNRCTLHCPVADYHGHRRYMHRVTVQGDRPF